MIKIKAVNVGGVRSATFDIEDGQIVLIGGSNASGKSSLLQAIGAALTGQPKIRGIATKKAAAGLVHEDGDSGGVSLKNGDGSIARCRWPEAEYSTEGSPPVASPYTSGVAHLADISANDRAAVLIDLLSAQPTKDDLANHIRKELEPEGVDIDDDGIDTVWSRTEDHGWDAASRYLHETQLRQKGGWERITGGQWGAKKARNWSPPGFTAIAGGNLQHYQDAVDVAKLAVERALRNEVLAGEKLAELERLVDAGTQAEADLAKLAADITAAELALKDATEHRESLPSPEETVFSKPCPHCGRDVWVVKAPGRGYSLQDLAEKPIGPNTVTQRRRDIAKADGHQKKCEDDLTRVMGRRTRLTAVVEAGKQARADWDALDKREIQEPTGAVEKARTTLRDAEAELAAYQMVMDATAQRLKVVRSIAATKATAAAGVRKAVLGGKLAELNDLLAENSEDIGLERVFIDEEMNVFMGQRPFHLLSESEQWRLRLVTNLALSSYQPTSILLVDRLDVLQPTLRVKVLTLLRKAGVKAVVAMTARSGPETIPDLSEHRWGQSYWMEAGALSPLS